MAGVSRLNQGVRFFTKGTRKGRTILARRTLSEIAIIMIVDNKNSEKVTTQVKDSVLKECLYEFCFSPLGTSAGSILNQYEKKTKVRTTKSTFSRHFNAQVHIENHGVLSLHDIRKNEIVPNLEKENCVDSNAPALQPLQKTVEKVLQNLFATKNDNIVRQRQENHKNNRLLTDNEEKFLVQLCKCLAYSGHGLVRSEVLSLCYERNRSTPTQKIALSSCLG
jgi:hypothetical protein